MEQNEFNFLIARYKGLSKEIEFAKNKMWAVTGATVALYGIVIKYFVCAWSAGLINFLICFAGLFYLISCHISLSRNNKRMSEVLKRFPSEREIEYILFDSDQEKIFKMKKGIRRKFYSWLIKNKSSFIPFLHYAVVAIGLFVVVLIAIFA